MGKDMLHRVSTYICTVFLLVFVSCGPSSGNGPDGDLPPVPDRDGDTISDEDEGCAEGRDSDGDGIPDCEDLDSDNDGIPDIIEAGRADIRLPPVDSDGDGIPDYLDLDSDNNGIPDEIEGANDFDGDGIGDYADPDNDGDTIPDIMEIGPNPAAPLDTDGDGIPDLWDVDSDNDGILDRHELYDDPDQDGIPSFRDLDSDGDCIPDRIEAGDNVLSTPPVDTDGDGRPDYKDLDSDNDGLADRAEDRNCDGVLDPGETSRVHADTDGDGVSDLIEVAAGTDPLDPLDNPQANGDFVFIVPYQEPPDPERDDLDFSTNLQIMDVYLLVDRSGTMRDEISSIRASIQDAANNVTCPPLGNGDPSNCIPDIWWGVGTVGYRGVNGQSYTNHLDMQPNPSLITNALPTEEPVSTSCCAEPLYLATWSTCTGGDVAAAGCSVGTPYPARTSCVGSPAGSAGIGYPCFRPNALPVIFLTTDEAPSQTYNCPAAAIVASAANNIGAKIVGVLGTGPTAQTRPDLEYLARETGAVDASTNPPTPIVIDSANGDAALAIAAAIRLLAKGVPLDLEATPVDDPSDAVNAVTAFISRLETYQPGTAQCTAGLQTEDSNSDGYPDRYRNVLPGTPVCWNLIPKQNTTVMSTDQPQLFRAKVEVRGGVTLLDTRNVFFLVPPRPWNVPIN
jgi:hypothetical protein